MLCQMKWLMHLPIQHLLVKHVWLGEHIAPPVSLTNGMFQIHLAVWNIGVFFLCASVTAACHYPSIFKRCIYIPWWILTSAELCVTTTVRKALSELICLGLCNNLKVMALPTERTEGDVAGKKPSADLVMISMMSLYINAPNLFNIFPFLEKISLCTAQYNLP